MDYYVIGKGFITEEEREQMYLDNLKDPVPGVDALYHRYSMSPEEFEKIHGYIPD